MSPHAPRPIALALWLGAAMLALGQGPAHAESQPDLTVIGAIVGPPAVYPGQKIAVSVRIKNTGLTATTRSCTVRLRLSQTYPSNGNVGIGTTSPSGSLYTESSEFSVSLPPLGSLREWQWSSASSWTPQAAPVRPGSSNSISVTVDATNVIAETNEANNRFWTSYRLLGRDWYVSPAGNNVTGDGSKARPFATVERTMQSASSGDHFYVPSSSGSATPNQQVLYGDPPTSVCAPEAYLCPPEDPPPATGGILFSSVQFPNSLSYTNFVAQGNWEAGSAVILGDRSDNPRNALEQGFVYADRYGLTGKVKLTLYDNETTKWKLGIGLQKTPFGERFMGVSITATFK